MYIFMWSFFFRCFIISFVLCILWVCECYFIMFILFSKFFFLFNLFFKKIIFCRIKGFLWNIKFVFGSFVYVFLWDFKINFLLNKVLIFLIILSGLWGCFFCFFGVILEVLFVVVCCVYESVRVLYWLFVLFKIGDY